LKSRAFVLIGVTLTLFTLLSCPPADAQSPIKIGVLLPLTGPLAGIGISNKAGIEVAFEEIQYRVSGREVRLLIEDSEGKPDVGITKARRLIEQEQVSILLGPVSSAVAIALRDYVVSKGVPWSLIFATAPQLTRELAAPNLFRHSYSAEQPQLPSAAYVRNKLGYAKVAVVGLDYVAGRAEARGFIDGYKAAGGQVVDEIYVPLGAADAAPFVTKVRPDAVDAVVLAGIWGGDAIRFIKALAEYGVKGRVPVVATVSAVAEGTMLPAIGKAALGIRSYGVYSAGIDNPENVRLVRAIRAKTGALASGDAYAGYITARPIIEALKAINARIEDRDAYLRALRAVDFVGPAGPFKFDEKQNAVISVYLFETREVDGELRNMVVDTIGRGVTQR
jgi:branched-chain amino acid transport system substrate-binding protein